MEPGFYQTLLLLVVQQLVCYGSGQSPQVTIVQLPQLPAQQQAGRQHHQQQQQQQPQEANETALLIHEAHEKEQTWNAYYHQLQKSRVDNQSLLDLLGPLMHYKHDLPLKQLRKSLAYKGSGSRLRHVLHKLITGNGTVKVGVVGTSISWGTGAGAWKGV